jgi:hypothetical protein
MDAYTVTTLRSCLPTATPPLRVMVSVGGKRTPLSARTDKALIQSEQDAARWNALRSTDA